MIGTRETITHHERHHGFHGFIDALTIALPFRFGPPFLAFYWKIRVSCHLTCRIHWTQRLQHRGINPSKWLVFGPLSALHRPVQWHWIHLLWMCHGMHRSWCCRIFRSSMSSIWLNRLTLVVFRRNLESSKMDCLVVAVVAAAAVVLAQYAHCWDHRIHCPICQHSRWMPINRTEYSRRYDRMTNRWIDWRFGMSQTMTMMVMPTVMLQFASIQPVLHFCAGFFFCHTIFVHIRLEFWRKCLFFRWDERFRGACKCVNAYVKH